MTAVVDYGFAQSELGWGDQFLDEANVRRVMQGIHDIGAARVRFNCPWDVVDKIGQPYFWTDVDRAVNIAAEYGLKTLLNMTIGHGKGGDGTPASYGTWCRAAAERYGPSGTNKVDTYELWNEENWSQYFQPTTPAAYTEFLKAGYTGIKSVQPSATVVTGGTIGARTYHGPAGLFFWIWVDNVVPTEWIQGIYDAGGKGYFDAIAMHWYSGTGYVDNITEVPADGAFDWEQMESVRAIMVAQGDSAKKIWVTEMGFALPGNLDNVTARDYLKKMFDLMAGQTYFGPAFIYSYKDASPTDAANFFGVVDYSYVQKPAYYDYVATLAAATPAGPDVTPPAAPTGVSAPPTEATETTAVIKWAPNAAADGVTNYRVYTSAGAKVADTVETSVTLTGLVPATLQSFYVTALDAAGNESAASATVPVTTNAPQGLQEFYSYNWVGSAATPAKWSQSGLGFTVTSNVALHNAPGSNGIYYTVSTFFQDQRTADHSSRIRIPATLYSDRAAMPCVRMSADGSSWVGALLYKGATDALQIVTYSSSKATVRKAVNATGLSGDLELTVKGNVYSVDVITNGSRNRWLSWTDLTGVYPGKSNLRTGIGWHHRRVRATNYPAPGITGEWRGSDVAAIKVTSKSLAYGVVPDNDLAEALATGRWQMYV